jgi:hypothetical protein
MRAPAFMFYTGDWLRDTQLQAAPTIVRGVWINALCRMWDAETRGKLSGTAEEIARLCGCTKEEFAVFLEAGKRFKFANLTIRDGNVTLTNRRMVRDEKARQDNANRQRRFYENHKPNADPNAAITTTSQPSSSSISFSKKEKNTLAIAPGWDRFWDAYPRKTAKKEARKTWVKLNPDAALAERIIADVSGGRWDGYEKGAIPHAKTYLNNERWEDEAVAPLTNGRPPKPLRDDGPTMAEVRSRE